MCVYKGAALNAKAPHALVLRSLLTAHCYLYLNCSVWFYELKVFGLAYATHIEYRV